MERMCSSLSQRGLISQEKNPLKPNSKGLQLWELVRRVL